jgi:hypothetical protein
MKSLGWKAAILCGRCFTIFEEFQIYLGWCWETLMKQCEGFEHFSTHPRPAQQMEEFRDVLAFCDLRDLGFCGLLFTWDNGRAGGANVRVRLDRAVADTA